MQYARRFHRLCLGLVSHTITTKQPLCLGLVSRTITTKQPLCLGLVSHTITTSSPSVEHDFPLQ